MSNEQRIRSIVEKANWTAGDWQRAETEREEEMNRRRDEHRQQLIVAWEKLRPHLGHFIQTLNPQLPERFRLHLRDHEVLQHIAQSVLFLLDIRMGGPDFLQLQRCDISVEASGSINVRMGTARHMPAKHYALSILEATPDRIEAIALDFVEINAEQWRG